METNKMIASVHPTDTEIRRDFTELLPELSSRLRGRFYQHDPDMREEQIAEGVATAWHTYLSARRRGREPTASNLSWYSSHCVLSGRKLAGSSSLDALSSTRTARERIGVHASLSDYQGDPQRSFYRTFGDNRWRWAVVDVVGTKIDWEVFISGCDHRDQQITKLKLAGYPQTEIAAKLEISAPAVSLRLRALSQRWDSQAVA
jgi:hypothetical protein